MIYKRRRYKGLGSASVLHVGNKSVLNKGWHRLARHWLSRGLPICQVECRLLDHLPQPSALRSGFNAKVFLSSTLRAEQIDCLYSESVALDL